MYFSPIKTRMKTASWLYLFVFALILTNVQVRAIAPVTITIMESALEKGAGCLDGSPPAYYYFKGTGNGVNNWMIYLEGGGWCTSELECLDKSRHNSGSTRSEQKYYMPFSGILDDDCKYNPDFCNWHKGFFHYCDGSSFSSNVPEIDPKTNLTFRGAKNYEVMMEEMMAKGLGDAQNVVLAGSSAGGLATILHCDKFRALFPNANKVKCIADSGFFIHGKGLPGLDLREQKRFGHGVIKQHGLANVLPTSCTSKRNPDLCLFPEYLVDDIQTPLFILESAFDEYQLPNNLLPAVANDKEVSNCKIDFGKCDPNLMSVIRDFRVTFIETLKKLKKNPTRGLYVHSCYRHVHITGRAGWTCSNVDHNIVAHKTIGQAISDWYFDRSPFYAIDEKKDTPFYCLVTGEGLPSFNTMCLNQIHDEF